MEDLLKNNPIKLITMKRNDYLSPAIQVIEIDAESVFCASPVFGDDGAPGNDFFDDGDIFDGGSF